MKKLAILTAAFVCASGALIPKDAAAQVSTVTVDNLGSGDFPTIQAAISSFCTGGPNGGASPPFTINVINGPYDEALSLNQSLVGTGDIQGDLTIQAPGSPVIVKIQSSATPLFIIYQTVRNVTLSNLIFCPSATGATGMAHMFRVSEVAGGPVVMNWVTFSDCVLTESDTLGNPLVQSKAEALGATYPVVRSGKFTASALMIQKQSNVTDGGGLSVRMENCTLYGSPGVQGEFLIAVAGEQVQIHNCVNAYAGAAGWRSTGGVAVGSFVFSGNDQTAGLLDCNVVLNAGGRTTADSEGIQLAPGAAGIGTTYDIHETVVIHNIAAHPRAVHGIRATGNAYATIRDSILVGSSYLYGSQPANAPAIRRVTFHNLPYTGTGTSLPAGIYFVGAGTGSMDVQDCVFSGPGTGISGTIPTGGMTVDYSSFVLAGPDALTAQDEGQLITYGTNSINADPLYVSTDPASADAFDVQNNAYAAAGSSGSNLAGGADFIVDVPAWEIY